MSDNKGKDSVVRQIVVAVVVALLVGGTAPWWWKEVFREKPGATEQPEGPATTQIVGESDGDGEHIEDTEREELSLDRGLTRHIWVSKGGGTSFLDPLLYPYRVGVSHTEDLPPAGESKVVFTYDISSLRNREIVSASLALQPSDVVGDPFRELGTLILEEISVGDASRLLAADRRRILGRLTSTPGSPMDVTASVREAVRRGARSFQVRLSFNQVYLTNVESELEARDSFLEWDTVPRLMARIR